MDSLFPLKVDIPDRPERYESFYHKMMSRTDIICFLFSSEAKTEEIKIADGSKIYFLGELKKNEKVLNIFYIEFFDENKPSKIKIEIAKKSFFINLDKKIFKYEKKKYFLFNPFLFDKDNKTIGKLNIFDIHEEFEIYYRIHYEKKSPNSESLDSLFASTMNIIKFGEEESTFSFYLTAFLKDPKKIIYFEKNYKEGVISTIKKKGDLSKISKDDLHKAVNNIKPKMAERIYFMYNILSQDVKEITNMNINVLIECLKINETLFKNSLQIFPNLTFLLDKSKSFEDIKAVLLYSNSLSDFVFTINEKKEQIAKIAKEVNLNLSYPPDLNCI